MKEPTWEEIGRLTEENTILRSRVTRLEEALREIADDETDYPRDVARRALEEK